MPAVGRDKASTGCEARHSVVIKLVFMMLRRERSTNWVMCNDCSRFCPSVKVNLLTPFQGKDKQIRNMLIFSMYSGTYPQAFFKEFKELKQASIYATQRG